MGWMWSSAPSDQQPPSNPTPRESTTTSKSPSSDALPATQEQPPPITKSSNREELAEAKLRSFLQSLEPPDRPASDIVPTTTADRSSISSQNNLRPSGLVPLTPSHTLPSSVSCRTIFDNAFHCQSLGGQWNSLYRYGGLRNCSGLWYEFWWCMRTNRGFMTEEERKRRVMRRYEEKERVLREGPNSEDIWQQRKVLLGSVWNERYEDEEESTNGSTGKAATGKGSMKGLYGG